MRLSWIVMSSLLAAVTFSVGAECPNKTTRKIAGNPDQNGFTECSQGTPPNQITWHCPKQNYDVQYTYTCDAPKTGHCCSTGEVVSAAIFTYLCGDGPTDPCEKSVDNIMGNDFVDATCVGEDNDCVVQPPSEE